MNVSSWRVQSGARWAYFEIMSIILESWNGFGALGVRSWGTWGSKRPRGGSKKPRGKPTVIIGGLNSGDKGDEGLGWRRTGGKRGGWGKIINARDKSSARPNHAQGIGWRIKNAFCPCRLPPFLSECGTIAMYRLWQLRDPCVSATLVYENEHKMAPKWYKMFQNEVKRAPNDKIIVPEMVQDGPQALYSTTHRQMSRFLRRVAGYFGPPKCALIFHHKTKRSAPPPPLFGPQNEILPPYKCHAII